MIRLLSGCFLLFVGFIALTVLFQNVDPGQFLMALLLSGGPLLLGGILVGNFLSEKLQEDRKNTRAQKDLQRRLIVQVAERKNGILTEAEVVAETGFPATMVRRLFSDLIVQGLVQIRPGESAEAVYEFPELIHKND